MALMGFREFNQARWVGIRPGHRGTQVLLDINVAPGTVEIIDGTQTTITYLTDWSLGMGRNVSAKTDMFITTNANVHVCTLAYIGTMTNHPSAVAIQALQYPIELPAGYKVKVTVVGVGSDVKGYLHGWEE